MKFERHAPPLLPHQPCTRPKPDGTRDGLDVIGMNRCLMCAVPLQYLEAHPNAGTCSLSVRDGNTAFHVSAGEAHIGPCPPCAELAPTLLIIRCLGGPITFHLRMVLAWYDAAFAPLAQQLGAWSAWS